MSNILTTACSPMHYSYTIRTNAVQTCSAYYLRHCELKSPVGFASRSLLMHSVPADVARHLSDRMLRAIGEIATTLTHVGISLSTLPPINQRAPMAKQHLLPNQDKRAINPPSSRSKAGLIHAVGSCCDECLHHIMA